MGAMCQDIPTVRTIVTTCCLLHNMILRRYPLAQKRYIQELNRKVRESKWRDFISTDHDLEVIPRNTATSASKELRALLKEYMYSIGRIPFQEERAGVPWNLTIIPKKTCPFQGKQTIIRETFLLLI